MIECEACGGVGYFSWPVCSDGCCGESRQCPFCNGEGEAPSPIVTTPSVPWWSGEGWDDPAPEGEVHWI